MMSRIRAAVRTALILLFYAIAFSDIAKAQQYPITYLDQSAGLGNLTVTALTQDTRGRLWVGTENGLYRYDGATFARVGGTSIRSVTEILAVDRLLLVGTSSELWIIDGLTVRPLRSPSGPLPINARENLVRRGPRQVLAVSNRHLFKLERQPDGGWTVRPFFSDKQLNALPELHRITRIAADTDGSLWIGCWQSLCRLRGEGSVELVKAPLADTSGWGQLFVDHRGDLWLRDGTQLVQRSKASSAFVDRTPPNSSLRDGLVLLPITEDAEGRILTALPDGIARWDGQGWERVGARNGLDVAGVYALLPGQQGEFWLGTAGRGLAMWHDYEHQSAWTKQSGLPNDDSWSFVRDSYGRLLIGTSSGTFALDKGSATLIHKSETIGSMTRDAHGNVWMGTFSGELYVLPATGRIPTRFATLPFIFRVFTDSLGRVWVCTQKGLFVIDLRQGLKLQRADVEINPNPEHGYRVFSGCESNSHVLWFSTDAGLLRLSGSRLERVQLIDEHGQLVSNPTYASIACGAGGQLWLAGGADSGLWQASENGNRARLAPMRMPEYLHDASTVSVLVDSRDWLWVSTDTGVLAWSGKRWRYFNQDNGLIWNDSNQNALYEDGDGSIWVGTSRGVQHFQHVDTLFEPMKRDAPLLSNETTTAVIDTRSPLVLPWSHSPLKLGLSSPWFESRHAERFRYRLEGFSDNWNITNSPELTLPILDPGEYRLEVVAENLDFQMQTPPTTVEIDVRPPWWRTRVAYAAYIALMLMFVWSLHRWRIRQLAHKQRRLEALVARRTHELEASREEMRILALTDGLTGVWNRRALMNLLESELARTRRENVALTIVIVDADHFKKINDTHGHLAGDIVLVEIAQRLKSSIRAYDSVGRYGGEEFILILPGLCTDRGSDILRLEACHHSISAAPISIGGGQSIFVTCSFGVATIRSRDEATPEMSIAAGDAALYVAKNKGRNRIEYAK